MVLVRTFVVASFLAILFGVTAARAQSGKGPPPTAREQERTARYNEGLALAQAGRWEEALPKFQEVVAIRSHPRALVALATAEEKTGRLTAAKRTYAKTQVDARSTGENELAERATSALAALESLLPHVVLRFPSGASDAAVTLDGAPVGASPQGIEVDPGEHRIVVAAAHSRPFEHTFRIAQAERREILVELTPTETQGTNVGMAPAGPPPDRPMARRPPIAVWILGGAGIAATAAGLVVRASAQSDYEDAQGRCVNHRCPLNDDVSQGNTARDRMLTGSILAGVGVTAMAGAGVWWALAATKPGRAGDPPVALSVRAHASTDGCWVRLNGAF
jgi:hypothetical protein